MLQCLEDYRPSAQAQAFHDSDALFKYLVWGIKSGKTYAGCKEILDTVVKKPGSFSWAVAPTYAHVEVCERQLLEMIEPDRDFLIKYNQNRKMFTFANGSIIKMRSAEWPDNLRGPNIDGCIWCEEASFLKAEAWWIIRSRVAATKAPIFATTTPSGWGWFYDEVLLSGYDPDKYGVYSDNNRWVSNYPTWDFPWPDPEHIEDAKRTMPHEIFMQEYGAKFVGAHGSVFPSVEEIMHLELVPKSPEPECEYVMGVDLAKQQDFTAIIVMDGRGKVVDILKWNKMSWPIQKEKILGVANEWKAMLVIDSAAMGAVLEDELRAAGAFVIGVATNAASTKQDLIQNLQVAIEYKRISFPHPQSEWALPLSKELLKEMRQYSISVTKTGKVSYSAPGGSHDDLVIALALANFGKRRGMAGAAGVSPSFQFSKPEDVIMQSQINKIATGHMRSYRGKVFGYGYRKFWSD